MSVTISAFYKFVAIDNPQELRDRLWTMLSPRDARGTVLVAPEGINGTISALPAAMANIQTEFRSDARFADLVTKDGTAECHPFGRLKVKLKREIITLRRPEANPSERTGTYVAPADWNRLITDPEVVVIDTRNTYEVDVGTFDGAVDPKLAHFTDWPAYVAGKLDGCRGRRIAMYCTGGIRCEKASAYLLAHGFSDVYQLEGGILGYLATVPDEESMWRGRCFVFDERGTVD